MKTAVSTKWGDREGRRRDILAAARSLLAETGYAGLGMRALAQRAGVSAGTLYLYFRTKEEIFLTIYSERTEQLRKEALAVGAEARTLGELIRRFADGYLEFYRELGKQLNVWALLADPDAVAQLPEELVTNLRVQVASIFLEVGARIEELAHAEGRTVIDSAKTVPFLWMTLGGLAESFTGVRAEAQPYRWDEMVSFTADTLVRGLTADERKTGGKKR